jgi:hypothetical protein
MASQFLLYDLGAGGVNVDSDPITLKDEELRQAQNAIRDPLGADSGLRKRPGLATFNTSLMGGSVLGAIGVPLDDLSANGTQFIYIGRGPTS